MGNDERGQDSGFMVTEGPPEGLDRLAPGGHVAFVAGNDADLASIKFRVAGLEVRDTILVMSSTRTYFIFLYRKPMSSVVDQTIETGIGTGLLNIEAARLESGIKMCTRKGCHHLKSQHDLTAPEGQRRCAAYDHKFVEACGCHDFQDDPRARFNNARGELDGSAYVVQRKTSFVDPGGAGRWPPNVVLVHDEACSEKSCVPSCVVWRLDALIGTIRFSEMTEENANHIVGGFEKGAGRFFPRFYSKNELLAWVRRLITPASAA